MRASSAIDRAVSVRSHPQAQSSRTGEINIPGFLLPALRSDHAGEAGAVEIYKGILAVSRDASVREFANHHLKTEIRHQELIEQILKPEHRTRLLPLCRGAGWVLGALPALIGAPAVYRTIDAVESFVDGHYREQIVALGHETTSQDLRGLLERCRSDEIAHRDDARSRLGRPGLIGRLWSSTVARVSGLGVALAERF